MKFTVLLNQLLSFLDQGLQFEVHIKPIQSVPFTYQRNEVVSKAIEWGSINLSIDLQKQNFLFRVENVANFSRFSKVRDSISSFYNTPSHTNIKKSNFDNNLVGKVCPGGFFQIAGQIPGSTLRLGNLCSGI